MMLATHAIKMRSGLLGCPELAQKYEQHFHQPETFVKLGGHLVILPTPDEAVQSAEEKAHAKPPTEHDR